MTKKRMEGYAVPLGWGKTDDEKTWGRAAQVVAAQMRDCIPSTLSVRHKKQKQTSLKKKKDFLDPPRYLAFLHIKTHPTLPTSPEQNEKR